VERKEIKEKTKEGKKRKKKEGARPTLHRKAAYQE
jgi:hypothetical protein